MAINASVPLVDQLGAGGSEAASFAIIVVACLLGLCFAAVQARLLARVSLQLDMSEQSLVVHDDQAAGSADNAQRKRGEQMVWIASAIKEGAEAFLAAEYRIVAIFSVFFGALILVLVGSAGNCGDAGQAGSCWPTGGFTLLAFAIGAVTSSCAGYMGMMVAVFANVRCCAEATRSWTGAFNAAFRGGAVMGFALTSSALLVLFLIVVLFKLFFLRAGSGMSNESAWLLLFEAVAGYGLGGSTIALFARVGGGIYTKAADVGADLVGKVEKNIPEDDPRNPAVIADNVGDNVGDIAGMGADLFGSFAESTCAALLLSAGSPQLFANYASLLFPLVVAAVGLVACMLCTFVATHVAPVRKDKDVETVLKTQLIVSTVVLTPLLALLAWLWLPNSFTFTVYITGTSPTSYWWGVFVCMACGLWTGLFTGLSTEYYTSHSYKPVREVAEVTQTGAATVIIYGLALGYKSAILPVAMLSVTIFASFYLAGLYGVAMAAVGMLSSLSIGLTIDGYGPITDNAGGIAEMSELGKPVRDITDTLDAAGNTTAAIGKGFAIGSAALVSLSLFGAYVTRVQHALGGTSDFGVNVLQPLTFGFLMIGAMLPYWFTAMTMKSVGIAARAMVEEVRHQFATIPGLMEGTGQADYKRCVAISTQASLREMVAPAALVIISPILCGFLFGVHALAGMLAGSLVSSVQLALSASNTGGAWDNAKKYIEAGNYGGKGSE